MTLTDPTTLDLTGVTTLLLDADGTLFPSEEPAFVASAGVTRALADRHGIEGDFDPGALRRAGTGRNFRSTARDLLRDAGVQVDAAELEEWVQREKDEVTGYLSTALRVEPDVVAAMEALARRYRLAVVSSSAKTRLLACFAASGLAERFPESVCFSAEDSLTPSISKPDPAIYLHALVRLGVPADATVAIEDSTTGARSAVAAGIRTLGLVQFVPADERNQRVADLLDVGAASVASSWDYLVALLSRSGRA
jgi:HAD superfamily hydrolase (TIGR01509 family)